MYSAYVYQPFPQATIFTHHILQIAWLLIWIITDNSRKQISLLTDELSHFSTFIKLLKVGDKRSCLHKMLQATVDKKNKVPEMLAQAFYQDMEKLLSKLCSPNHNNLKVNKFMEWVES